jgi:hypothetical protein
MAPALVANVTEAPETGAPPESVTTAVIVTPDDPSPGTVAPVDVTATAEGVPVVVEPVPHELPEVVELLDPLVREPQPLSPPQPARASNVTPNRTAIEANLRIFLT